jgi:hypothetical protein
VDSRTTEAIKEGNYHKDTGTIDSVEEDLHRRTQDTEEEEATVRHRDKDKDKQDTDNETDPWVTDQVEELGRPVRPVKEATALHPLGKGMDKATVKAASMGTSNNGRVNHRGVTEANKDGDDPARKRIAVYSSISYILVI